MRFGHPLSKLTLCVGLCSAVTGYGRGGETGTLDKEPDAPDAGRSWSPYYLGNDHFRRLRARLSLKPLDEDFGTVTVSPVVSAIAA